MNDDTWLGDVLRQAASTVPPRADRMPRVRQLISRRRRQRVVMASCAAVAAVFVATTVTVGGSGANGLRPADPGTTPTATATPGADATEQPPVPAAGDSAAPDPAATDSAEPDPTPAEPVPFDAGLPPGGGEKLDLYVLLDVTGGMGFRNDYPRSVAAIDTYLRDAHVDLTWGYGTFKDWYLGTATQKVYHRVREQAREVPDFTNEPPFAGGADAPEATTFGLDGSVGIGYMPYTTDTDGATFRTDARKVVLVVTDAPMKQGDSRPAGPSYPSIADTIRHLVDHGVSVVALQALDGAAPEEQARIDLERVSRGTGGVATVPLDLDGIPGNEVGRGDPLVLPYDGSGDGMRDFARGLLGLVRTKG